MPKPRLLIVDDHEHILKQLAWALKEDFDVHTALSKAEALDKLREVRPSLLTVDLTLSPYGGPRREGFDVLAAALRLDAAIKAIVITSDQDEATAMEAVRLGAFDYFTKPLPLEELQAALKRAAYRSDLERRAQRAADVPATVAGIVGESAAMVELCGLVRRVAQTDLTVLILGESGVGKELIARAVWSLGGRGDKPYVVVNCAAIPETLLESELFGHEKGSFTGAHAQKKGKLEVADTGTVFLDEIGDLSPGLQAKLLRFLQERTVERVGSTRPIKLDVRVVAATNRDLQSDVQAKVFREDLYYRLKVLPVRVPPLRERGDDVILLANYFLDRAAADTGAPRRRLSRDAETALMRHHWPGNVRELENVIRAAAVTCTRESIAARDLDLGPEAAGPTGLRDARDQVERAMIERALQRNQGVVSHAAKELEISRVTLYDLMQKHGIRVGDGGQGNGEN
ncbi:sigma-54 dependent transcriptional regulator [Candidatus Binatia bacterium]|nr:sigma-54 dependent transcriptional regulator [Candidatus Binatia bacterium]